MTVCKNTAAGGCKCVEHDLGLAAFAPDPAAYLAALEPVRRRNQLRVIAPPEPTNPGASGLTIDRARRRRDVRQPWQPRPSRYAA